MNQLLNQANAAVLSTLGAPSQTTQTMSSREIAQLTGKRHDNVLRDIDKMLTDLGFHSPHFRGEYQDDIGRTLPMYNLPQRELLTLVSGYKTVPRSRVLERLAALAAEKALANQQLTAVSTAVQAAVTQEQPMFLSDQFEAYLNVVEGEIGGKRQKCVDGRELHALLSPESRYRDWVARCMTDELVEGSDFQPREFARLGRDAPGTDKQTNVELMLDVDYVPVKKDRDARDASGPDERLDHLLTLEGAKIVASLQRSDAGKRVRRWLVAVEEEAHKRVEAEREAELAAARATPPVAQSRLEMARELVLALEREEAAVAEAARMAETFAANVLIPRTNVEEHQPSLSLEDFKRLHAPDLSIKVIRQVLQYFGQDRTLRQFGSTPAASTRPFTLDGAAEKIARFRREATKAISRSGLGIVLTHDCLLGDTARVNKTYAIKYYGYTQSHFEADSQ